MKRTFIFVPLFILTTVCLAQADKNKFITATIDSLINVVRDNDTDFTKAMDDVQLAKDLAITHLQSMDPLYARCLYYEGRILYRQEKYDEAKKRCLDALTIQSEVLGHEHPDYVRSVAGLSDIYLQEGDFARAETRLLEAHAVTQQTGRTSDNEYADLLTSLGNYYRILGNLDKAGEYYLECLHIREKVVGKNHKKYASALHNLALVKLQKGEYDTAEKLFLEAQVTLAQTIGTKSENYGICIQNLSGLYRKTGDFEKAEKLALESLELTGDILGKNHSDYAINLENIGNLYLEMGQYDAAKDYYLQCLKLREDILGKEHITYALALNNYGNYHKAVRNFGQADDLFSMALDIFQKKLGDEHYYTLLAKDNLAWSYREQGKYEDAEPLILEVIRVLDKYLGSEHPDLARSLVNLAFLKKHTGHYQEAEKLYHQAGQIWIKTSGPESLDYLANLQELASILVINGQTEAALSHMAEAGQRQKTAYHRASRHMTKNELSAYTARFSDYLHRHFSYLHYLRIAPSEASARAYDYAIFHKGYLLENARRVKKFTIQDATLAAQYQEMVSLQKALAREFAKPPSLRSGVQDIEDCLNVIEKTLVTSVAGYEEIFRQVGWREIQQKLRPDEVAIEFIHYKYLSAGRPTDSIMYAAIVIRSGRAFPDFVPLFEEKNLTRLIENGKGQRMEAINRLYSFNQSQPENSLDFLLMQPLQKAIGDATTLYFSPSGLLHQLNPEAIQNANGQVVAERFNWVRLGSTRQLVFPGPEISYSGPALLFGGIHYNSDDTDISMVSNELPTTEDVTSRRSAVADSTLLHIRDRHWEYLSWTKTEIETISLLTEGRGIPTVLLSGKEGSEEACKELGLPGRSPRLLHMATHGYFFPNPAQAFTDAAVFQTSDHPMIRSGLILAGGNYAWKNGRPIRPDVDDGILTAYEIAQMDLSQTELVVLSACETGLGDIQETEGVFGLQRAFRFSGAKYILMSLWQVPDFQTQELMTDFYFNWLEKGMAIPTAFQAAQKALLRKYPEPFLWAGFVLMQ